VAESGKRVAAGPAYRHRLRDFTPFIGVLAASGILKGLLALAVVCGWLTRSREPIKSGLPPATRCSFSSRCFSAIPPGKNLAATRLSPW
jgi:PTS system beta-glucosides-specific IIC component